VTDNRSLYVSEKRWSVAGRGADWCPVVRERYLALEKLTNGLYQMLLRFVYADEFAQTLQRPGAWDKFILPKSIAWNDPGRSGFHLARRLLRAAFGLGALGPAPVRCMGCVLQA
jgi:hypothetical protein